MTLLPDTLHQLITSGASLRVDANRLSISQLNRLAAAAAESGAALTITNAHRLTPETARGLAAIGGKQIAFEV